MRRRARLISWIAGAALALGTTAAHAAFTVTHDSPDYTPGQNLTVTTTMTFDEALTALGYSATIPTGWTFVSATDTSPAAFVKPTVGATGTLEWAWLQMPTSPATFTYTLAVPAGNTGDKTVDAQAEYRTTGAAIIVPATPDPLTVSQFVAPTPVLTLAPASHAYGDVFVGSFADQTFTLSNTGTANVVVSGMTLSNTTDFALTPLTCGNTTPTIAPGANCTVRVAFGPKSVNTFNATLSVASNDAGSPDTATLSGTGVAVPVPDIAVAPASLSFGSVEQGQTSAAQTVTVSNTGDANLVVSGMTVPTGFTLNAAGGATPCGNTTPTIAAGANCTVQVIFAPTAAQAYSGNLSIASNDTDENPKLVALSGTGTAVPVPQITLAPATHDFGTVVTGATAGPVTVTIGNDDSATKDLDVDSIALSDTTNYTLDVNAGTTPCGAAPFALSPADTCTVAVSFAPTAAGTLNATLSVVSNDPDSATATVSLLGAGREPAPDIAVSPTSADFGVVATNTTSAAQAILIANEGELDLEVASVTLSDTTNFVLNPTAGTNACGAAPFTVAPGEDCEVSVAAKPTSADRLTATLTVASDDPDEASVVVNLAVGQVPTGGDDDDDDNGWCFLRALGL